VVWLQAILISMCLQGIVDELIMKKEGRKIMKVDYCYFLLAPFVPFVSYSFCLFFKNNAL